jgi:hypothetical protein
MRAFASAGYPRLEKTKENCHIGGVGSFSGRRRGRLYDNQNQWFRPALSSPNHIDSPSRRGVFIDPAACCRLHDYSRAGAFRHSLGFTF